MFEHFSRGEGCKLLNALRDLLTPGGLVVLRVPNAASPWGLQYQFGDLTHKATYGPGSLLHLAQAAGFETLAQLSVRHGSRVRRIVDALVHSVLDQVITDPPPLWGANMIAVLRPKADNEQG
ncbi:MAG: hypothetical protein HN403_00205 [Rhodospirillales bacterium]|nr:hypothetical protein [Rhodospirillales bacterium]